MRIVLSLLISLFVVFSATQVSFASTALVDQELAKTNFILETAEWKAFQFLGLAQGNESYDLNRMGAGNSIAEAIKENVLESARISLLPSLALLHQELNSKSDSQITGLSEEETLLATQMLKQLHPIQLRVVTTRVITTNGSSEAPDVLVDEVLPGEVVSPMMFNLLDLTDGSISESTDVKPPTTRRVSGKGKSFAEALMNGLMPEYSFVKKVNRLISEGKINSENDSINAYLLAELTKNPNICLPSVMSLIVGRSGGVPSLKEMICKDRVLKNYRSYQNKVTVLQK